MGRKGPAPALIGHAIEPVYRAILSHKNRAFDAGRGVERVDVPVISIGNLSVGGTGKTPMVMWVVARLRALGRNPAIAMRGYGAKRDGMSDEQAEYLDRFPGIPIVAQPDRIAGLRAIEGKYDCVVLDDGFQHRRLARDLDIVLIDATRDVFADRCLPAGWLREPVDSLTRAGAVVITRSDLVDAAQVAQMEHAVRAIAPRMVIGRAVHAWDHLGIVEPTGAHRDGPTQWLRGKRVVVACGIANPEALTAQVERSGATIVGSVALPDHAVWTEADMSRVATTAVGSDGIVVTEKDWVKVRGRHAAWSVAVVRPRVVMDLGASGDVIGGVVEKAIQGRGAGTMPA